jgi:surface protein
MANFSNFQEGQEVDIYIHNKWIPGKIVGIENYTVFNNKTFEDVRNIKPNHIRGLRIKGIRETNLVINNKIEYKEDNELKKGTIIDIIYKVNAGGNGSSDFFEKVSHFKIRPRQTIQWADSVEITDDNIKTLVDIYVEGNKNNLPKNLRTKKIGEWIVSGVTKMNNLFKNYTEFNEDINDWDVSNVTNMARMFQGCEKFNKPLNKWKVSNVTNMSFMFKYCYKFNQDLSEWDVSNVINMDFMFDMCSSFKGNIDKWDVSNVESMREMFAECRNLAKKPDWIIDTNTNIEDIFWATNFQGEVLERRPYNVKKANEDIENALDVLSKVTVEIKPGNKTALPEDIKHKIISVFDPHNFTKTKKKLEDKRTKEIERVKNKTKTEHPDGGGGYAEGGRRKTQRRRKTQKFNHKLKQK